MDAIPAPTIPVESATLATPIENSLWTLGTWEGGREGGKDKGEREGGREGGIERDEGHCAYNAMVLYYCTWSCIQTKCAMSLSHSLLEWNGAHLFRE